jgi:hypothetical protein
MSYDASVEPPGGKPKGRGARARNRGRGVQRRRGRPPAQAIGIGFAEGDDAGTAGVLHRRARDFESLSAHTRAGMSFAHVRPSCAARDVASINGNGSSQCLSQAIVLATVRESMVIDVDVATDRQIG